MNHDEENLRAMLYLHSILARSSNSCCADFKLKILHIYKIVLKYCHKEVSLRNESFYRMNPDTFFGLRRSAKVTQQLIKPSFHFSFFRETILVKVFFLWMLEHLILRWILLDQIYFLSTSKCPSIKYKVSSPLPSDFHIQNKWPILSVCI